MVWRMTARRSNKKKKKPPEKNGGKNFHSEKGDAHLKKEMSLPCFRKTGFVGKWSVLPPLLLLPPLQPDWLSRWPVLLGVEPPAPAAAGGVLGRDR